MGQEPTIYQKVAYFNHTFLIPWQKKDRFSIYSNKTVVPNDFHFPYSSADEGSVECISCQAESISFCFTVALPYFLLQVNSVVSFVLSFFLVHLLFVFFFSSC